jgi:hypothetical protein
MNRLIGGFRSDGARPANVAPKAWASVTNPQDISMTAGSRSRHGAPPARRGRRWAGGQPRNPPQPRFGHWRRTDVLRPRPPRAGRLTSRRRSANEGRLACPRGSGEGSFAGPRLTPLPATQDVQGDPGQPRPPAVGPAPEPRHTPGDPWRDSATSGPKDEEAPFLREGEWRARTRPTRDGRWT